MSVAVQSQNVVRRNYALDALNWLIRNPAYFSLIMIVVVCCVVGLINPSFWQISNLFDILRSSTINGVFALGVMIVLAAGGLDVSFAAIAAFSMYCVTLLVVNYMPGLPILPIFMMGAVGGVTLGLLNGFLVNSLKAPSLIVTIGTQYVIRGFLLTFIGTALFMNIPVAMDSFGQVNLISITDSNGFVVSLPAYILIWAALAALTAWILKYTLLGRAIYAVGGAPDIAQRLGYNVNIIRLFVFAYAGMLAGVAGILHVSSNRLANPFDLAGIELQVIAAVILGGARITGGTGTVIGTLLGAILITLINNVLILLGIPSTWQFAIIGLFILVAGVMFSIQPRR